MDTNVKSLFQPLQIGNVVLKNRLVMPPMDTNFATIEGGVSRKQFAYYKNRARGGMGLIITEATSVAWPEGKISERQLNLSDDSATTDLRELAGSIHAFGAKLFIQIHHGGFMAVPEYCRGAQNVSCSDVNGARALSIEEIKEIENKFIHAAEIVKKAGADGVEVHAAHMYLLNQFLNPSCNQRTDEYGGNHENRFRIIKNIIKGIREKCGTDFVIDVRLGAFDYADNGNTIEDGVIYAKMCEEAGADMLNLSIGFYTVIETEPTQWDEEGKFLFISEAVKKAVSIPVCIVGKLRTPAFCAKVIEDGKADMVAIGRQSICDAEYANKILQGKADQIRPCLNCLEGCIGQFYFGHDTLKCSINPYIGYEDLYSENAVAAAGVKKTILVVGGGIAGMQYAIIAKKRGHKVLLAEAKNKLGGEMILASKTPYKKDVKNALEWFADETSRVGVEIHLNTKVDLQYIEDTNPDAVVLAMGSRFTMPPIDGIEHAVNGEDVLSGDFNVGTGKKLAIIGGGVAGCELAHLLIEQGNSVSIFEILPELCMVHEFAHRMQLVGFLNEKAQIHTSASVRSITSDTIKYIDSEKNEHTLPVDMTICCAGQKKISDTLYEELLRTGREVYRIGDFEKSSNFRLSTKSAFELANTL